MASSTQKTNNNWEGIELKGTEGIDQEEAAVERFEGDWRKIDWKEFDWKEFGLEQLVEELDMPEEHLQT